MDERLEGRRVLVTGASSGIGEATVRALTGAGARVAAVARREDRLRDLAEQTGSVPLTADVADEAAISAAVDAAATALGGLDGVVNDAGVQLLAPFADGRSDEWRTLLDVNVLGLLYTTHAALRHLRAAGGGDVVWMGSVAGRRMTGSTGAVYTGTKFAVRAMAEALRMELHREGIRVCVVSPGWVHTELGLGMADEGERAGARRQQEEIGLDPADVAAEIVHALARPPHVTLHEIAVLPTAED